MLKSVTNMISCFRCKVAENCTLLAYYAASSGNFHYSCVITQKSTVPKYEGINQNAWFGTNFKLDRPQDTMKI